MSGGETLLFWVLAPLSVLGALGLMFARKTVHAAVSMAAVMVVMGIFYIAQDAEFVGIIQVFVYSGAVMMLFLFVIMLIGVDSSESLVETLRGRRLAAWLLGLGFAALAVVGLSRVAFPEATGLATAQSEGSITALAREIFERQVFGFEVLGTLLVIAVMGAMVLAHRERLTPRTSQREMALRRVRSGRLLAGKPAPGVYAKHNAADTPALLPDGSPSELSVPRVLVARNQVSRSDQYALATDATYQSITAAGTEDDQHPTERERGSQPVSLTWYVYLAVVLFTIGALVVLTRRNTIVVFMGVELMLNACNLALITFARMHGTVDGHVYALFVMVVAASEVVVGLAIIMSIFRARRSASVDDANLLRL